MSRTLQNLPIPAGWSSGRPLLVACTSLGLLAGCSETGEFVFKDAFSKKEAEEELVTRAPAADTTLVERDVEAPDIFFASEAGLWDGRPSLGGVWVAHPDVVDPERVMIRNAANDKFVVGALFRRERDIPGPQLQISSDAAEALGMLAGAPAQLEVVALRKESIPIAAETPIAETDTLENAPLVETASLDPIAGAAAAIEAAPLTGETGSTTAEDVMREASLAPNDASVITEAEATSSKPFTAPATPVKRAGDLEKPFVQIGIFSLEFNADRTANILRGMGMVPTVKPLEQGGKKFWRIVVGPATSEDERNQLLAQIKKQGYSDAYPVTN